MVSSSHMKLLPKTALSSDNDNEVKESEEINGKRGRDESWQTLCKKIIVLGETLIENLDWAVACPLCHTKMALLDNLN